ncbi:MAG: ATP-binding protein [Cyclobacteriaceae bacterium]|jgi:predicted AAA+ superfamily ATPase
MVIRTIFEELRGHLLQKQVTVITGMRRVGKSTAVKYLLNQVKHSNKLYLDCERVEVRALLNRPDYEGIAEELQLRGLDFLRPCVVALDEIQLVENLPSLIKYLYDTYSIKFIVTGSSSYYLKNRFSESLAGRKRLFEMFPLTFAEFLLFKEANIRGISSYAWKSFNQAWYNRCKSLYEEYLTYGGFPEVVLSPKRTDKTELLKDIINSYIELDVKLLSDFSASENLYKLVRLLAARAGSKVDFSKISTLSGLNRQKVTAYIHLLEYTYLIYLIHPFTRNIDQEISQQPKLFFSDTGLIHVLAGGQVASGHLFENAIAAQLKPQGEVMYYQKKSGQEIDFIFNRKTAIEVKETATREDFATLEHRAKAIGLSDHTLISRYPGSRDFAKFVWGGNIF